MNLPRLIILCGVPAVGKSTYSKNFLSKYPEAVHLTSDGIRKELYGAEAILGDRNTVFSLMVKRASEYLADGKTVLYDSTALTRLSRGEVIEKCPACVRVSCVMLWAPRELCIERDAARDRTVGPRVIDELTALFEAPFYDEGIDDIQILLPEGFDAAAYERSKDLPPPDMTIEDEDVRFAARCLAGKIHPWEAVGLPGATPQGIWLISACLAGKGSGYRKNLPLFLQKLLAQLE